MTSPQNGGDLEQTTAVELADRLSGVTVEPAA